VIFRQAITTKYVGPTNTRGSRVKASCDAQSRIYGWDDALNVDQNHTMAALRLMRELEWHKPHGGCSKVRLVGGCTKNNYHFVIVELDSNGSILDE
jgi:hypothetical protein